jgi:hypothetical protein
MSLLLCSRQVQRPAHSYQGAGPGRAGCAWKAGTQPCCPSHAVAGQQLQRAGGAGDSCHTTAEGQWGSGVQLVVG